MTDLATAAARAWAATVNRCPYCQTFQSGWWEGAPWHYLAGCVPADRRPAPPARPSARPRTRARSTRTGTSHREAEIIALHRAVKRHRRYGHLVSVDALDAALDLWHTHTGELSWARPAGDGGGPVPSYPGEVGMARWSLMRARAGEPRDPLDGVDQTAPAWRLARAITTTDDTSAEYRADYSWTGGELAAGEQFTTWDVVGQYLAASRCDVGRGDPGLITVDHPLWDPRLPGYVRFRADWTAPDPRIGAFRAGVWVHTAIAKYLQVDRGWTPPWDQAVLWPGKWRPLYTWGEPFRTLLAALHSDTSLPARLACVAAKAVYTGSLGGMLRSRKYNRVGYQPDTAAAIVATGWANSWRNWDKAQLGTRHLFGGRRDTVWVAGDPTPPQGLRIASPDAYQPGTWQRERWGIVDAELAAAHSRGRYALVNSGIIRVNRDREAA